VRWRTGRRSQNVEDRRGAGGVFAGGGMRLGGGALILLLLMILFGVDPSVLLQVLGDAGGPGVQVPDVQTPAGGPQDELADFVAVVLGDTEDTWAGLFAQAGARYQAPRLVLFSDAVRSGCGVAGAAVGPFYCSLDQTVYIDLAFYRDLRDRFRAPGDFAQAYVIAHEVGHHVQHLLGTSGEVNELRRRVSEREGNQLSVRLELQADCYAGLWAHHAHRARQLLEEGDVEEGLAAAAAIGDDRIQRQTQGHVVPESFTHGSSEQRVHWFRTGLASGSLDACDSFGAP